MRLQQPPVAHHAPDRADRYAQLARRLLQRQPVRAIDRGGMRAAARGVIRSAASATWEARRRVACRCSPRRARPPESGSHHTLRNDHRPVTRCALNPLEWRCDAAQTQDIPTWFARLSSRACRLADPRSKPPAICHDSRRVKARRGLRRRPRPHARRQHASSPTPSSAARDTSSCRKTTQKSWGKYVTEDVAFVAVPDTRVALAEAAAGFYGHPAHDAGHDRRHRHRRQDDDDASHRARPERRADCARATSAASSSASAARSR